MVFEPSRRLGPGLIRHASAGHAQQFATQRLGQRAFTEADLGKRRADEIRHRHEVLAQCLGQVAHQRHRLRFQQPRYQPVEPLAAQLRQQRRRHPQGDTIARVVGLEMVFQRQLQLADTQVVRVLRGGDFAGLAGEHVFLAHDQQLRVLCTFALVPVLEAGGLVDVRRQPRIVVVEQGFLVGEDVAPPRLGFQLVETLQQLAIGGERLRAAVHLATHQPFADKQLACSRRIDRPIVHRPAANDDHAVERYLLVSHHLATLLLPVRLEVVLLDQVVGQRLDPVRLDLGDHASEQLGGFHEFGGHQPVGLLAADYAGGVYPEASLSRTEKVALLGLVANLAEQAGEDRLVHRRVALGLLRRLAGFGLLAKDDVDLGVGGRCGLRVGPGRTRGRGFTVFQPACLIGVR